MSIPRVRVAEVESDEYFEWLMWKMAQKYEDEHANAPSADKRINWNALKSVPVEDTKY